LDDLLTDVQTLSDKMRSNAERINHTDSIISVLSERDQLSEAERLAFSRWNMSLAFESYFIPEKSTISQFEASDNGHLIAEALKDKLFSYYATSATTLPTNAWKPMWNGACSCTSTIS